MALTVRHDAFQLLAPHKQFVVYGTAPRKGTVGKLDKFPIDPATGHRLPKWNSPQAWRSFDEAFEASALHPDQRGVGFVFTAEDNFHFLDIDGCVEDGPSGQVFSPQALELVEMFPGSFREVSVSGKGLHIIFYATGMPDHGTRASIDGLSLELYSRDRFCACTGNCWPAAQLLDYRASGERLASRFPPAKRGGKVEFDWTDEPLVPQHLSTDDDEVIRRLLDVA